MLRLQREKKSAVEYVKRRYENWDDNYKLYRNKVTTNRLTQRQEVNIPLMKETVKTLLSKIDDAPAVDWRELSGNKDKEIIFQEYWNDDYDTLNLEGVDIQDKKTVLLYGRGVKKLNWVDGKIDIRCLDIYDFLIDPLVDPLNIDTARYVIHQNIFRSLDEILADDKYTKKGRKDLETYLNSSNAVFQSSEAREQWEKKMNRMKEMGLTSDNSMLFAAGDTVINLTEHYTKIWDDKKKDYDIHVVVYANDTIELMDEKLSDMLGIDFYPFVTWAEDIETQDFWSDSPADLVRTPNKVLNIWFSQLIENRTLRNFQMHWYDATNSGYTPQTYEPGPGRMLPAPGDPNKTIKPVDISGLDETMTAIEFVTSIIERGSAATAIEKGVEEPGQQTLGEIQILVGKATERTIAMAKMYRRAWQELCQKYWQIVNANAGEKRTLYKEANEQVYPKVVYSSDWKSPAGYRATVTSSSEQESESTKGLQKFQFAISQFPLNSKLRKIGQKRILELLDLTPQEIKEIQDEEDKVAEQQMQMQAMGMGNTAGQMKPQQPQQAMPVQSALPVK